MQTIGLIYNPRVEASIPLAQEIAAWLESRGVSSWLCSTHKRPADGACLFKSDLLITLGGDGTILRAAPLTAPLGIPLLGLNLGRVGFLTECEPEHWVEVLERILANEGSVEERMMLQVTHLREGTMRAREFALNDAVISRGALARTVHLFTTIDGAVMTEYVADALILATATGSTAYSYAVGGPILPPWLDNIVVAPVAAHLSLDRPLVLNAQAVIEITVRATIPGMVTIDGRLVGELLEGDCVRVERSPLKARFLRLRNRADFYRTLVARLSPRNSVDTGN
ncbi:MAG: putative inorganic polyphosphate/ATP-NAD kinase [Chloroflexi bacterium ADurb.Bin360]|nr:MAG: putative inorganic polyphosphate/ATP-NAD kinase [Chloroflexi bacterium ADurb.Bin360]